jgi:hypothetical protein
VPVSLFSISNGDNALRIAVPSNVVDSAINNAVFALCESIADTVPDSDYTTGIPTSDIESGGGEPGDCGLCFVFVVLPRDGRVVNRTYEDGFIRLRTGSPFD